MPRTLFTDSREATRELGQRIGAGLVSGDVLLLHGDLGAGKTTLAQGIAAGLGVREYVQSPTFTLVQEHAGRTATGEPLMLFHLDLYRLTGGDELASFGYEEFISPIDGVTVIEWPERAEGWLPERYLLVELIPAGPDRREVRFTGVGDWHRLDGLLAN